MPGGYSYLYRGTQGAKEHGEEAINVITDVIQWGRKKGLGDPKAQLNKVIEEVGEIAHEISRNNYDLDALEQPDECAACPLLGKRPAEELTKGQRQAYCCLGIFTPDGFPPLTSKGIERSAAAYRKQKRLLHRPCDDQWEKWMSLPNRKYPITIDAWRERRRPYELEMELKHYKSLFKK